MNNLPTLEVVIDLIKTKQVPEDMGVALLVSKNIQLQTVLEFDAETFAGLACCGNSEMTVPMDEHFDMVNYPILLSKDGNQLSQDEVVDQLKADIAQLDFVEYCRTESNRHPLG